MEFVEPIRDPELVKQIEDYLRRRRQRDWILFVAGCSTGLRISDLRKLRTRDVRGKSHLVVRTTKTGRRVQVLITPRLARALDSYTADLEPDDYLFRSREGFNKPLTRSRCYQILKEAAKACGLEHIGCHSLRKTFGYWLHKQTGDVGLLQELLGHTHPSVTLRYLGICQDDLDTAMRRFSIGQ